MKWVQQNLQETGKKGSKNIKFVEITKHLDSKFAGILKPVIPLDV